MTVGEKIAEAINGTGDGGEVVTSNKRINLLMAGAYLTILACLAVVVWFTQIGEYAQGVITLVIGKFLGYTDAVYNYEFSTTRASKAKDAVIATQAQAVAENNGK